MASSFDKAITVVNSLLVGDADWDGGATVSGIELSRNGIVVNLGSGKHIELKTSGTGAIKMEAFGSAVIYLNTLLEKDLDAGFSAASIIGALNELKAAATDSKWFSGTVENISVASGGGTAIGSIDISCNQGLVTELLAYVQTGVTDDVDVELGDASFSGSPNILYQIGQNDALEGLWVPDTNGNWKDRNAWGFKGLTGGLLYYRFTNNGANAITMGILVDVIGKV